MYGKGGFFVTMGNSTDDLLATPLEKAEGSPVEQMLHMIEYITMKSWDDDCEPSVSILPVDDMY